VLSSTVLYNFIGRKTKFISQRYVSRGGVDINEKKSDS
jgi:hypothetical protein